mmetsp:Transcript_59239/g.123731  ORF Transcript_59239/g.123731 Transcript_59239/m.123731 type:complete len:576 (-) Transcript_59239:159-1886(-)
MQNHQSVVQGGDDVLPPGLCEPVSRHLQLCRPFRGVRPREPGRAEPGGLGLRTIFGHGDIDGGGAAAHHRPKHHRLESQAAARRRRAAVRGVDLLRGDRGGGEAGPVRGAGAVRPHELAHPRLVGQPGAAVADQVGAPHRLDLRQQRLHLPQLHQRARPRGPRRLGPRQAVAVRRGLLRPQRPVRPQPQLPTHPVGVGPGGLRRVGGRGQLGACVRAGRVGGVCGAGGAGVRAGGGDVRGEPRDGPGGPVRDGQRAAADGHGRAALRPGRRGDAAERLREPGRVGRGRGGAARVDEAEHGGAGGAGGRGDVVRRGGGADDAGGRGGHGGPARGDGGERAGPRAAAARDGHPPHGRGRGAQRDAERGVAEHRERAADPRGQGRRRLLRPARHGGLRAGAGGRGHAAHHGRQQVRRRRRPARRPGGGRLQRGGGPDQPARVAGGVGGAGGAVRRGGERVPAGVVRAALRRARPRPEPRHGLRDHPRAQRRRRRLALGWNRARDVVPVEVPRRHGEDADVLAASRDGDNHLARSSTADADQVDGLVVGQELPPHDVAGPHVERCYHIQIRVHKYALGL